MKALRFETYGPPSVLSLDKLRAPDIKPGEALVAVYASAVNPSDVKNVAGVFKASLPRVPGRDYAGVVVAGEGWVGKPVWGSGHGFGITRDGTHAQYLVADMDSLSIKPSALSMEEASTIGVAYLAAWSGLVTAADIRAGETVYQRGPRRGRTSGHADREMERGKSIAADIVSGANDADAFINVKDGDIWPPRCAD